MSFVAEQSKNLWNGLTNGIGAVMGNRQLVEPVATQIPNFGQPNFPQNNQPQQPIQNNNNGGGLGAFLSGGNNQNQHQNAQYEQQYQNAQQGQGQNRQNEQQGQQQNQQYQSNQQNQSFQNNQNQGVDQFGNPIQNNQNPANWGFGNDNRYHPAYQNAMQNGGGGFMAGGFNPQGQSPIYKPEVKIDDKTLDFHATMMMKMFEVKVKMVDTIPKAGFKKYLTRKEDAAVLAEHKKNPVKDIDNDSALGKALERKTMLENLEKQQASLPMKEAMDFMQIIIKEDLKEQQRQGILQLPKTTEYQRDLITMMALGYSEIGLYVIQDMGSKFTDRFGSTVGKVFDKIGLGT